MKAARIHAFGEPAVLALDEIATPTPEADEVLVRVYAASINPIDYKVRSGMHASANEDRLPLILGRDVAGVVEACGAEVKEFVVGDEIYTLLDSARGGYAEYVSISWQECARKPTRLTFAQAAAVPLAAITAWQGLFDHGLLSANQRVLIQGGAGGVGHFAVQLAKARGAWVATTVGTEDVEFARSLGADLVIDYETQRFEELVQNVDLVFDLIGGEVQERSLAVLTSGGALISSLGIKSPERARDLGIRAQSYYAKPNGAELRELTRLIDQSKVTPYVLATYALSDIRVAHERAEKHHMRGKIVLTMAP